MTIAAVPEAPPGRTRARAGHKVRSTAAAVRRDMSIPDSGNPRRSRSRPCWLWVCSGRRGPVSHRPSYPIPFCRVVIITPPARTKPHRLFDILTLRPRRQDALICHENGGRYQDHRCSARSSSPGGPAAPRCLNCNSDLNRNSDSAMHCRVYYHASSVATAKYPACLASCDGHFSRPRVSRPAGHGDRFFFFSPSVGITRLPPPAS